MAIPIWNMIKAATMGNLNALSVAAAFASNFGTMMLGVLVAIVLGVLGNLNALSVAAAFASNFGTMMLGVLVAIVLGVLVQGTYIHNYRFKGGCFH